VHQKLVKKNAYRIILYMGKASSELFINDGELVSTNTVFPEEPYNTMVFESDSEISVVNMTVNKIK
jgi:fructan beta-fructosidase